MFFLKRKFLMALFLALFPFFLCSGESLNWQVDANFPDWINSANFSANSLLPFVFYHGQGKAFVTVSKECTSFSFYINDKAVNTKPLKAGGTYVVDISKFTLDGKNILQVSDINPPRLKNAVRVCIPYPEVLEGSLKNSSIQSESIYLIDRIISSDVEHGFSSAQLAVVKDGRLVFKKCWGNVTNESLYDLASVSKMFSAAYAIQLLVSQGKLSVDAKICEILGKEFADDTLDINFSNREKIPLEKIKEWKRQITVSDVISHKAGFASGYPYFNDNFDLAKSEFNAGKNKNPLFSGNDSSEKTRELTLEQIFKTPLVYEPGTKLVYSDIDFMILCFLVEKVSGQRMDSFLKENFWQPLGLSRITYNPLQNGFSREDCAPTDISGNSYSGNLSFTACRTDVIQGQVHDANAYHAMAGISGHAGLFSNAEDLARLASIMLSGGYGSHRFFSRNVIDLFTSPQLLQSADYGMGWWRGGQVQNARNFSSICSSRSFGHNGFTGTLVFLEPEENLVIVYLTNKINSRLLSPQTFSNQFSGNFYQSANLGFVPQLILLGMKKNVSRTQFKSLLYDMKEDARRVAERNAGSDKSDSRWQAYESLKNVYEEF